MAGESRRKGGDVVRMRSPQASSPAQLPLLPLRANAEIPAAFGSADLKRIVRTLDGHYYAVKSAQDHPMLPASEFLCYRLAASCHLPVPFSAVVEMQAQNQQKEYVFGSRFEGGITEFTTKGPSVDLEMFRQSAEPVSAVLAFDLFVGNEDRHRGNFLFRKNRDERWVPLAIDYSRALLVRDFPNDVFPIPEESNTRRTIHLLKRAGLWQGPFAVFSLESLAEVTSDHLRHWFMEMPSEWMSEAAKATLLQWWSSDSFKRRLNDLYDLL